MIFTSVNFLLFFLVLILLLWISKNRIQQQVILLIASYIFYSSFSWQFSFLLLGLSVFVYFSAIQIHGAKKRNGPSQLYLCVGVIVPLLILFYFKYCNFFLNSIYMLLGITQSSTLSIILPIGISFYTFQALSYVIDIYRGKLNPEKSFLRLALYIAFFPQLLSGPIVKARDFLPQLTEFKTITWSNLQVGVQVFIFGLFKKLVIADYLGVLVSDVYSAPLAYDSATVWLAVISYSLQIYFDFSGYSDMAIGCARCMGYNLTENFNMPYISKNITEFWKRWHISLSSWLQEYLYFSLGGNRCSKLRNYFNIMITMLLCGLWHGAGWTFVLWGGLHGLLLWIHKFYSKEWVPNIQLPIVLKLSSTFLSVSLCWIFFRAENIETVKNIFYRLFFWEPFAIHQMYVYSWIAIVVMMVTALCAIKFNGWQGYRFIIEIVSFKSFVILWIEIFAILGLMYTGHNPFIYFQF